MVSRKSFQSPYGDFGTLTLTENIRDGASVFLSVSVPLRGFWYSDTLEANCSVPSRGWFQSPYGDFGTLTLSPSTRSQTGLTGDFFKPPAFLAFFSDPGEK